MNLDPGRFKIETVEQFKIETVEQKLRIYSLYSTLKAPNMNEHVVKFENSSDPDKVAHNEQSHRDLHCLFSSL